MANGKYMALGVVLRAGLASSFVTLTVTAPAVAQPPAAKSSSDEFWNSQVLGWTRQITKGNLTRSKLADAYWNRGLNYATLDKHELAVVDFDRAIKLYGTPLTKAHYNRASSLAALGRGAEAKKELAMLTAQQRALNDKMAARPGYHACKHHPAFKSAISLTFQSEAALKRRDMLGANKLADAGWWAAIATIRGFDLVRRAGILDDSEGAYEHTVEIVERKGLLEDAAREKLTILRETLWMYGNSSCAGTPATVRMELDWPPLVKRDERK